MVTVSANVPLAAIAGDMGASPNSSATNPMITVKRAAKVGGRRLDLDREIGAESRFMTDPHGYRHHRTKLPPSRHATAAGIPNGRRAPDLLNLHQALTDSPSDRSRKVESRSAPRLKLRSNA
jgi:hypothetical protein